MFTSILNETAGSLSVTSAIICTAASLILGLLIAAVYVFGGKCTKSFAVTVAMLPVLVQIVIMMVNGNLGAGVAVMGAFSLVRFRSFPGSSKEIAVIFFAMAIGLATGMGYITFAALFTVIVAALFLILCRTGFAESSDRQRTLRITIPEALDYTDVFSDIFKQYTESAALERVKTTNLGSMFELTYSVRLKDVTAEKKMLDDIRCKNGNLTIICAAVPLNNDTL